MEYITYGWSIILIFFNHLFNWLKLCMTTLVSDFSMSQEHKEDMVRKELSKWKMDMYAQNPNMHIIPSLQVHSKRRELEKKYGL